MKFPQSGDGATIVLKILESHSHHIHWQSLWKFSSMLRVKAKSMLLELSLQILTRTTVFAVYRCFHDHSRRTLVRSLRNFHGNIAVECVHACLLQECICDMKDLKFASNSRRIGGNKNILRPGKNNLDRTFLCNQVRDCDVLSCMPIIGDVRLKGQTLAEVFGRRLQNAEVLSVATHGGYSYQDRHTGQINLFELFEFR